MAVIGPTALMWATLAWGGAALAQTAPAQPSPAALCRRLVTDDRLRPVPDSLVPAAERLFDLGAMPADQIRRSTHFRCFERQVLVCNVGANLPCGKANTRRRLPAAEAWCAEPGHADDDFIPMYVTGHDSIYQWRCRGGTAAIVRRVFKVDRRGFVAEFWKRVDP